MYQLGSLPGIMWFHDSMSSHCHSAKVNSGGDNQTKRGMALLNIEKMKMHEQVIVREDLKCANHLKNIIMQGKIFETFNCTMYQSVFSPSDF